MIIESEYGLGQDPKPLFRKKKLGDFTIANLSFIKNLKIPLPPLEVQEKIVAEFEKLEKQIAVRKQRLENLKNAYNEILDKYLK